MYEKYLTICWYIIILENNWSKLDMFVNLTVLFSLPGKSYLRKILGIYSILKL